MSDQIEMRLRPYKFADIATDNADDMDDALVSAGGGWVILQWRLRVDENTATGWSDVRKENE